MPYIKYLKYVLRHKWFVFTECYKIGILWLGIIHDWSKFRPSEFIPYARHFYGHYRSLKDLTVWEKNFIHFGLLKEDINRRFDVAWLFHIHRNKHHWQYWLLQKNDGPLKNIPIPKKYLKEMLADWKGAGKAITGKDHTAKWYEDNKHRINLNWVDRAWIEKKLTQQEMDEDKLYWSGWK